MGELPPRDEAHPKAVSTPLKSKSDQGKRKYSKSSQKKKLIFSYYHKEGHTLKPCLAHLQKTEELARSTICTKDLFNENDGSLHTAHLVVLIFQA